MTKPVPGGFKGLERNIYSQTGEDGVTLNLFHLLGEGGKYCVEFGAGDGSTGSNTKVLRKRGWRSLLLDKNPRGIRGIVKTIINAANINGLFDEHDVPEVIDFLSIDIDGNDLWVWRAIERKARVVVIEYNQIHGPQTSVTIPYDPDHSWDGTNYYGASALALKRLGEEKGMIPVHCTPLNMFFVDRDLVGGEDLKHELKLPESDTGGHPPDPRNRPWIQYP